MKIPTTFARLLASAMIASTTYASTYYLTPEGDATIQGGESAAIVNTSPILEVAARGASDKNSVRKIFLAFSLDDAVAKKIKSVRLVLVYRPGSTVISDASSVSSVTIAVYGAPGMDWSESDLTWESAPLHDPSLTSEASNPNVTLLAEQTVDTGAADMGTALTFSDERLAEFLRQHPGMVTFVITSESDKDAPGLRFYDSSGAKDDELKPQLIIETK